MVAKLLIVATFVEDALRVLFTFGVQQQSMEIAGWTSPALHTLLPLLSLAVQSCGALLVLASSGVGGEVGCYLLLGWCVWHPFMYGQAGNREFVLETATISGGLLILLSHLLLLRTKAPLLGGVSSAAAQEQKDRTATAHRIQAVGRVLVVSFFLYVAATKTHAWCSFLCPASQTLPTLAPSLRHPPPLRPTLPPPSLPRQPTPPHPTSSPLPPHLAPRASPPLPLSLSLPPSSPRPPAPPGCACTSNSTDGRPAPPACAAPQERLALPRTRGRAGRVGVGHEDGAS